MIQVAIIKLESILINKPINTPYNVIQYITGEVIYGGTFQLNNFLAKKKYKYCILKGRVTDDYDRRCLMSILSRFFCNDAVKEDFSYGNSIDIEIKT